MQERKEDTRRKIMLGGLLIKAGWSNYHPHNSTLIYGMLVDALDQLEKKPILQKRWRDIGRKSFGKDSFG